VYPQYDYIAFAVSSCKKRDAVAQMAPLKPSLRLV
jgi:hypothetical protein